MRPLRHLEQQGAARSRSCTPTATPARSTSTSGRRALRARRSVRWPSPTHASNVTGVLLPVARDRGERRRRRACRSSSTPRRAPGTSRSTLPALGAAAVAMPGHKGLLGPTGTGLLYLAPGRRDRAADPRRHRQPVRARGAARLRSRPVRERHAERDRDRRARRRRGVSRARSGIDERPASASPSSAGASATALGRRRRCHAARARPTRPTASGSLSLNIDGVPCATVCAAPRRRVGRDDPRRPPLLPRRASQPRHRARGHAPLLVGQRHDRGTTSTWLSRRSARSPRETAATRRRGQLA